MGICAHAGVRVGLAVADHHDPGEVFDVHLVDDAGARRHDTELVERTLPPPQELVALEVALILQCHVELQRLGATEIVGDDTVVDDQFGRCQRVDPVGVPTHLGERLAHGGQIHDTRHTGEVLHDHPGRCELDLLAGGGTGIPGRQRADLLSRDVGAVLGAQEVLQQYPMGVGQVQLAERVEPEDLERLLPHLQLRLGTETVEAGHARLPSLIR